MESHDNFAHRLTEYLHYSLIYAGYKQNYESLETLVVKNSYFKSQPKPEKTFMKEHGTGLW